MKYWLITFSSLPLIRFAHVYTTEKYDIDFSTRSNSIEITYIVQGAVEYSADDGESRRIEPESINVMFYDKVCRMRAEKSVHSHFTICFVCDYRKQLLSAQQVIALDSQWECENGRLTAVIPDTLTGMSGSTALRRLQEIVREHSVGSGMRMTRCAGLFLELMAELTRESTRLALSQLNEAFPPAGELYVRKAKEFISENLGENLTTSLLAGRLGVSEGYLATLFHTVTGMSVTKYVTDIRIHRVRMMIDVNGMTLREAGRLVGLEDEHYLSRLFKRYTGMSAREYRSARFKEDSK